MLAVGSYETIALLTTVVVLTFTVYHFVINDHVKYIFVSLFIVGCISLSISFLAPGNFARAATGSTNLDMDFIFFLKNIIKSLYFTLGKITSWIFDPILLITSFFIVLFLAKSRMQRSLVFEKAKLFLYVIPLISWVGLSISVFPNYYLDADVKPRVWDVVYFAFLVAWFANLYIFAIYFKDRVLNLLSDINFQRLSLVLQAGVIIYMFTAQTSVVNAAYVDLLFKASEYKEAMNERYQFLEENAGVNTVIELESILPRTYMYPFTIYGGDISRDQNSSTNLMYAKFFGIKAIKLKQKTSLITTPTPTPTPTPTVNFYDAASNKR